MPPTLLRRHLIAGQRRLEAYKRLGKKRIEVKFYGELSKEARRELELEEKLKITEGFLQMVGVMLIH